MLNQEQNKKIKITDVVQGNKEISFKLLKEKKEENLGNKQAEGSFLNKWLKNKEEIGKKFEKVEEIKFKKEESIKKNEDAEQTQKQSIIEENEEDFLESEIGEERSASTIKKYLIIFVLLAIIGGAIYGTIEFLPSAEIKIIAKKTNWNFSDSITASKNIGEIDFANRKIPASFFSDKKNIVLSYPASGKKYVERKAEGEIAVYNAYSSQPQTFVKGTRFETSDGKIFRLNEKTIVPGAKIEEGKIIFSSIKAKVSAEKPGEEYNIGPMERFTIPGLKGTPKYDGFYAKSENPMSNGFVGEVAYPTESDIKTAKEKTKQSLEESLTDFILSRIPDGFKFIDNARQFSILKESINEKSENEFSVFLEAELTAAVFKESDVLKIMNYLAKQNFGQNFESKEYELKYGAGQIDVSGEKLSINLDYKGNFWQPIKIEEVEDSVLGKKESELKAMIFSLPGVEKATISFWPFWVNKTPDNVKRVKVTVE